VGGRGGGVLPIEAVQATLTEVDEEVDVMQQLLPELGRGEISFPGASLREGGREGESSY